MRRSDMYRLRGTELNMRRSDGHGGWYYDDEIVDGYFEDHPTRKPSPQERTRAMVYATGNKWAIENYEATH